VAYSAALFSCPLVTAVAAKLHSSVVNHAHTVSLMFQLWVMSRQLRQDEDRRKQWCASLDQVGNRPPNAYHNRVMFRLVYRPDGAESGDLGDHEVRA
jgi:hypothetical protein